MKRRKNHQGFHKRQRGSAASPGLAQSIRNTLQRGDYAAALTAVDQALATVTDAGEQSVLLSLAGDCLFRQGKYAEAAETYGEVLEQVRGLPLFWLRPATGQIHSLLKDVQVEAAQNQALVAMQMATDFHQQYEAQVEQAVTATANGGQAVIPAEPPAPAKVAGRLGKVFFSEGEIATAKSLFQQAVQLEPDHVKALLGLAEIAVRENDAATAIATARQALAANHYHAQTLSAWNLLFAAGRLAGADVLDAALLTQLKSQAPAAVQARAILLIVKNLRAQGDARWQTLSANWLQTADTTDTTHKIVAAELRKLNLSDTRITNASAAEKIQRAEALLQTPGISPGEWLCATKQQVSAALAQNQMPDMDTLLAQGATIYGVALRPKFTHSLALCCQKTGQMETAKTLFQRNAADANVSAEQQGKSLWALARLQSQQGDHEGAAQSFWSYSQNEGMLQRFRLYAMLQFALELLRSGQREQIELATPQLKTALAQISDHEVLLDVARQLRYAQFQSGKELAADAYQRGKAIALQQFDAAANPSLAVSLIFKFSRRAFDFSQLNDIIATWARLDQNKRQWLWSADTDYWNWQELILRAYVASNQTALAESFGAAALNDTATPPEAVAILGATYLTMKLQKDDFTGMYVICERMVKSAPAHERTAVAYYWLALRAWKRSDTALTKAYAQRMLLALGKDCSLYWKAKLQAAACGLAAGLEISQLPTQSHVSAGDVQAQLADIQGDLSSLPNSI